MNISESRKLKSSYVPSGEYLRIYTGSENTEDLIEDLNSGFNSIRKIIKN
jgi:cystathionine beta-lyase/cystathionine gamma-synthase